MIAPLLLSIAAGALPLTPAPSAPPAAGPASAAQKVATAAQKVGTAEQKVGPAAQKVGTAEQKVGPAAQKVATAAPPTPASTPAANLPGAQNGSRSAAAGAVSTALGNIARIPGSAKFTRIPRSAKVAKIPKTARALPSPLRRAGGQQQWNAFSAAGFNQEINHSATGINILNGGVRWSYLWGEHFAGFLKGHPAFAIEVLPAMAFTEAHQTTWGSGANLLYEHHFAVSGRVLPVWQIGAGLLYTNRAIPAGETHHNFSLLTALGVDLMVDDTTAVFLGYRFHHVSNANTGNVNPGINLHSIVIGLSFYR